MEALPTDTLVLLITDATEILAARADTSGLPSATPALCSASPVPSQSSSSSIVVESWAVVVCRLLRIPLYREDDLSGSSEVDFTE